MKTGMGLGGLSRYNSPKYIRKQIKGASENSITQVMAGHKQVKNTVYTS